MVVIYIQIISSSADLTSRISVKSFPIFFGKSELVVLIEINASLTHFTVFPAVYISKEFRGLSLTTTVLTVSVLPPRLLRLYLLRRF
jgi:hypothetical protein